MRLKIIERVDFRKSELTNFTELVKRRRLKLGPDDVALLISATGSQIVFVHRIDTTEEFPVLRSMRLRFTNKNCSWNPTMLSEYIKELGLPLMGVKLFERYYKNEPRNAAA